MKKKNYGQVNDRQLLPCPERVPVFRGTTVFRKTVRYVAGSAITGTATNTQIGNFLVVGGGTTTVYKVCNFIRVRSVTIWGGPPSTGAPSTIVFQWSGTVAASIGPNQQWSDTSIGMTHVARLKVKPPVNSQAAQWQSTGGGAAPGTNVLFNYSLPANSVIQISLDASVNDDNTASSVTVSGGATLGVIFAATLDLPGTVLVPVGGQPPIS